MTREQVTIQLLMGHIEALEETIKTLEQEPILDKIRAEIEWQRKEASNKHSENDELQAFYNGLNDGLKDARDIIDKKRGLDADSN